MANYNCYLIDKHGKQVFFNDKPDLTKGDLYISVSQVLSMLGGNDFLIKWALRLFGGRLDPIAAYDNYMETVSDLGSRLHLYVECDLKNKPFPEDQLKSDMLPGVEAWEEFKKAHQIEMIDSERVLFSRKHRLAGTMDLRIKIDGQLYVADLKTGSVMDKAFTQLMAYKMMLVEMGLSNGEERLLVLGGSDSQNKIADGGKVCMHTLESWFRDQVTEEDLYVELMCLRKLWEKANLKSRKWQPIIKGMQAYIDPIIQRFRDSFKLDLKPKSKKKGTNKK